MSKPSPARYRSTNWSSYHVRSRLEAKMRYLKAFGERIAERDPDRRNPDPNRTHEPLLGPPNGRHRSRRLMPWGKGAIMPQAGVTQQRRSGSTSTHASQARGCTWASSWYGSGAFVDYSCRSSDPLDSPCESSKHGLPQQLPLKPQARKISLRRMCLQLNVPSLFHRQSSVHQFLWSHT